MWKQRLEERIEAARKRMEESAKILGFGHPKVYRLSQELDQLHNEWQRKQKKLYCFHSQSPLIKEKPVLSYRTVV